MILVSSCWAGISSTMNKPHKIMTQNKLHQTLQELEDALKAGQYNNCKTLLRGWRCVLNQQKYQILVCNHGTIIYDAEGKKTLHRLPPAPGINWKAEADIFGTDLFPEGDDTQYTAEELAGSLKYLGFVDVENVIPALQ